VSVAMAVKQERRGKPLDSRSELDGLERIRCWNCGRIVATGTIPALPSGRMLVIQCGHRECKAFNKFEG
jgi:hypothetical protein